MRIGIIGAGHAGVEAARVSARAGASVVLYSGEQVLPYFRPRLVALAFGQVTEEKMSLNSASWYKDNRIDLRLDRVVDDIDAGMASVVSRGTKESYDALILATGAGPVVPPFADGLNDCVAPLWNIRHAGMIREKVRKSARIVIVGGGVIGVEAALRAADAGMNVVIVEKMNSLMLANLGQSGGSALADRLIRKGIRVITGTGVAGVVRSETGGAIVTLSGNEKFDADICMVSVGVARDTSLARRAGLDVDIGVKVDREMFTSAGRVLACGDIAQTGNVGGRCSVPEALAQGRVAGANAVATGGSARQSHVPVNPPVILKYGDLELRAIGMPAGPGNEQKALDGSDAFNYRTVVIKDGVVVGAQMIGNCSQFEEYAKQIKEKQS
jgi:nitrite reductase (NADH) large subunit